MEAVKGKRPYSSPLRERSARATREAVLTAAQALFIAQGYGATTIDDIAAAAEVSRPTVFSVGSKAELLKLVRDRIIAGDDEPVPIVDRAPMAEMRDTRDPEAALRLHARNVAGINERYCEIDEVLRRAASTDPVLGQLWESSEQQRLEGATIVVDDVRRKGALKPGIDRGQAIDILWLLMAPDLWARLRRRDWTATDYEVWLADTLVAQLLP